METKYSSQFTSHLYRETLKNHGFQQSMGQTGCCYDNARAESFFATLKKEIIHKLPLYKLTKDEVRIKIMAWVEGYYNKKRRNTANAGNLAPLKKREQYYAEQKAA